MNADWDGGDSDIVKNVQDDVDDADDNDSGR